MPLFNSTPPPSPNPGEPYDASREAAHIRSSDESQSTIEAISDFLLGYPPQLITDAATGNQYYVLASPAGSGAIALAGTLNALQPAADVSTMSAPIVSMTYGTYIGAVPTISGVALVPTAASNTITLGTSDTIVYMQCDFTYDATTGAITVIDAMITSTSAPLPAFSSVGGGSGTIYQILFGVTITSDSSGYHVAFAPAVGGSQNASVCIGNSSGIPTTSDSIIGPYGI